MKSDRILLNVERLNEQLKHEQLDAIVGTAPENVTYMSGFWALSQWIRRGPQAYVLWPAPGKGEPEIITSTSTLDLVADQSSWISKVRSFGAFHVDQQSEVRLTSSSEAFASLLKVPNEADSLSALVAALQSAGIRRGRVGIDEIGLMPGRFETLVDRMPEIEFVPAASLLRIVRRIKTAEEILRLSRIAKITERSIEAALAVASTGKTEAELARAFHTKTVQEDALPVLGCIGFGERSALPNVQPSQRQLQEGDVIRFDVGGRYQHYRADIARIAAFGDPGPEVRRYHAALLAGIHRAYEIIRPGARVTDIFDAVIETVRREGIGHYRRSHVGHGIGLDGYDAPSLTASSAEILEAGMVLCIETPYYELGRWGLQVEDMVVVRPDGVESLMTSTGDLIEVAP